MTEEIVSHVFRVNIMNTNVHVQTCLNIIFGDDSFSELCTCFFCAINERLIFWRHPATLYLCCLLFICILLFILAHHCGQYLNNFFWILIIVPSLFIFHNQLFFIFFTWLFKLLIIMRLKICHFLFLRVFG